MLISFFNIYFLIFVNLILFSFSILILFFYFCCTDFLYAILILLSSFFHFPFPVEEPRHVSSDRFVLSKVSVVWVGFYNCQLTICTCILQSCYSISPPPPPLPPPPPTTTSPLPSPPHPLLLLFLLLLLFFLLLFLLLLTSLLSPPPLPLPPLPPLPPPPPTSPRVLYRGGEPWDFPPPPDMLSPPPEIFQRINFFKLHYKGIITLEFLNCITKESLHYKGILRLFCLNISKISSKFTFLRSGASIAIRMILERFRSPKRFRSLVFIIFI